MKKRKEILSKLISIKKFAKKMKRSKQKNVYFARNPSRTRKASIYKLLFHNARYRDFRTNRVVDTIVFFKEQ